MSAVFRLLGVVQHVYEAAVVVAVGGEMVRYLPSDLQPIENPSPVLQEVCDRVARLWKVQNKPEVVRHLLETFYQKRLDFGQKDLDFLEALQGYVRHGVGA